MSDAYQSFTCCRRSAGSSICGSFEAWARFYNSTGRPSINPELFVRTLLVGYCYGIGRSVDCATRPPEPRLSATSERPLRCSRRIPFAAIAQNLRKLAKLIPPPALMPSELGQTLACRFSMHAPIANLPTSSTQSAISRQWPRLIRHLIGFPDLSGFARRDLTDCDRFT